MIRYDIYIYMIYDIYIYIYQISSIHNDNLKTGSES